MTDLRDQLREYGQQHRAEQRPVTSDEIRWADRAFQREGGDMTQPMTARPRLGLAVAAAAVVIMLIGVIAWIARMSPAVDPASQSTTIADPGPAGSFGPEDALAVATAYIEASRAGDFEAIRSLFTNETQFVNNFGTIGLEEFLVVEELFEAWEQAQGTILSQADCSSSDQVDEIVVTCTYTNQSAVAQAVGGPAVPITLTLRFDTDGNVTRLLDIFGQPDFNTTDAGFDNWMAANHPDDAGTVTCCEGETVAESEVRGALRASYARDYAAYLAANGCVYDEPCEAAAPNPVVVFDGESCLYTGPAEIAGPAVIRFSYTNTSDALASVGVWRVPQGTASEDIDQSARHTALPGELVNVRWQVPTGETVTLIAAMEPGPHMLNCFVNPRDATEPTPAQHNPVFFEVVEG